MTIFLQDQLRQQLLDDPYTAYGILRQQQDPVYLPHHPHEPNLTGGKWLLSTYAQAVALLRHTTAISKRSDLLRPEGRPIGFDLSMLFQDEPDHLRLRSLVADFFKAQTVKHYEQRIESAASDLLDNLELLGKADAINHFAEVIPLQVLADLIGLPKAMMSKIREWSLLIAEAADDLVPSGKSILRRADAYREMSDFIAHVLDVPELLPPETLLGHLQRARAGSVISTEEAISMVFLLLFAGHETTTSLIGSAIYLLITHPLQLQQLRYQPELIDPAVEEVLRFESPEQRSTFRVTTESIEICGHRFQSGEQLSVILGSANRDEKVFDRADEFLIARRPNPHLAFGIGKHHCLGRHLARLVARIAVRQFFDRFPEARLVGTPQWHPIGFFRCLEKLPVGLAG
jgi:cytochrome P450